MQIISLQRFILRSWYWDVKNAIGILIVIVIKIISSTKLRINQSYIEEHCVFAFSEKRIENESSSHIVPFHSVKSDKTSFDINGYVTFYTKHCLKQCLL